MNEYVCVCVCVSIYMSKKIHGMISECVQCRPAATRKEEFFTLFVLPLIDVIESDEILLIFISNRSRILRRSQDRFFRSELAIEIRHVISTFLEQEEEEEESK